MASKKILITAQWPVGGIRTYFQYIYSRHDFSEYLFTFVMPNIQDISGFLREHCPSMNFEFIDSGNSLSKLLFLVGRELLRGDYDLVHSHGYTAGAVTSLAAVVNSNSKHLMTAHDVFLNEQFEGGSSKVKRQLMSTLFNRIDLIQAVSEDCKENFSEFFPNIKQEKLRYTLHGIDTEKFFSEPSQDFRLQLSLPPNTFLFGFFGRFMAQKGFRYIVEAVELLLEREPKYSDSVKVLTFGWGGFIREEYQEIDRKGLGNIFVQVPYTDNVAGAIKGVDTVLMPSLWEACGLLGMEALVAGTPIIGSSCIGLREVLKDSPAGIVTPKNSSQLSIMMENFIVESRRRDFSDYRCIATKRFSIDRPAAALKGLYLELL